MLGVVDDKDVDALFCRFELEAELLAKGREEQRAVRINRRCGRCVERHGYVRQPVEFEIECAAQASTILYRPMVGHRTAEEARQIHKGEAAERPIHGTATIQETKELADEGVPFLPLPKPELDS